MYFDYVFLGVYIALRFSVEHPRWALGIIILMAGYFAVRGMALIFWYFRGLNSGEG